MSCLLEGTFEQTQGQLHKYRQYVKTFSWFDQLAVNQGAISITFWIQK